MTNSSRLVSRFALAGFAALTLLAMAAPSRAAMPFDGSWSVLIVTEKGDCDRGYRYPVKITNGTVGYAGEASFTVSGHVTDNGAINVKLSRGDKSAQGAGQLAGNSGSGAWKASGCSGVWTAERRS